MPKAKRGTGYSLHLGVNFIDPAHYGDDGELKACEFDAKDMAAIAKKQGFGETTILLTRDATTTNLFSKMTELSTKLVAGDMLLLTYAGHGAQVRDVTSDEDDGMDETWCLYDRMVLDDELYRLFGLFKAGVRIFMLSDSCHSGSVARFRLALGQDVAGDARDAAAGIAPRGAKPAEKARIRLLPLDRSFSVHAANRDMYLAAKATAAGSEREAPRAEVVLISGCLDSQVSLDGSSNGLFTSMLKAVWKDGKFKGGYRAFRDEIAANMPPSQTPNLYMPHKVSAGFLNSKPFAI